MTKTESVGPQQAVMATVDLVPVHPGFTDGIRVLTEAVSPEDAPCLPASCPPSQGIEGGVQAWVLDAVRKREAGEEYSYAIVGDEGLVGLCSLRGIPAEPRAAHLAYLIDRRHWRRGYATEATGMLVAFGFRCLLLERIYASCPPADAEARRVLEKLGFRFTHEGPVPHPDPDRGEHHLHFEFSRSQWEARALAQ